MEELFSIDQSSLYRFLVRWYGDPDLPLVAKESASHVPLILHEWHRLAKCWSRPITALNTPVPLDDLMQIEDKTVFWEEAQGGQVWAFRHEIDEVNPTVLCCDPNDRPIDWIDTKEDLFRFLLHATVFEAIWNSEVSIAAHKVQEMILAEILEEFSELALPRWSWPTKDTRVFADSQNLALVLRRGSTNLEIDERVDYVMLSSNSWGSIERFLKWQVNWHQSSGP